MSGSSLLVGANLSLTIGVPIGVREYGEDQRAHILRLCAGNEDLCHQLLELLAMVELKLKVMKSERSKSAQDQRMYTEVYRIWSAGTLVKNQGIELSSTIRLVTNSTLSKDWDIQAMSVYESIMKTLCTMSESFRRYFCRFVATGNDWASLDGFYIISTSKWEAALNSMAKFYSHYGKAVTVSLASASLLSFCGAVAVFFTALVAPPITTRIAAGAGFGLGLFSFFSSRAENAAQLRYNDASKAYERFSQFAKTLKKSSSDADVTENLTEMLIVLQQFRDLVNPKVAVSEVQCSICLDQVVLRGEQELSVASSTESSSHSVDDCNLPHCHHRIDIDERKEQDDDEDADEETAAVRPVTDIECKHIFHRKCLTQHLNTRRDERGMATCPECRGKFSTIAKI